MSKKTWIVIIIVLVLVLALVIGAIVWIGARDNGQQPNVPGVSEERETDGSGEDNATTPPAKDPAEQDPGYEYIDNTTEVTDPAAQPTENPAEKPTEKPTEQPPEDGTQEGPSVGPNQTPWG